MNRREIIFELYHKKYSYREIGEIIGISRQRVHQIIKDYVKDNYKSKKLLIKISRGCAICGQEAIEVHHKDHNPRNANIKNLIPLCRRCHKDIHLSLNAKKIKNNVREIKKHKLWSRSFHKCIICGEKKHYARNLCKKCYMSWWFDFKKRYEDEY